MYLDILYTILIMILHRTIFIVLSSKARSHMREFSLCPLSESRSEPDWMPTRRPSLKTAIGRILTHLPAYYYPITRLILIYLEGGRLSRPRQCSKCAAGAKSSVTQWFSWKHKTFLWRAFDPGISHAAGKSVLQLDHSDLRPAHRTLQTGAGYIDEHPKS